MVASAIIAGITAAINIGVGVSKGVSSKRAMESQQRVADKRNGYYDRMETYNKKLGNRSRSMAKKNFAEQQKIYGAQKGLLDAKTDFNNKATAGATKREFRNQFQDTELNKLNSAQTKQSFLGMV